MPPRKPRTKSTADIRHTGDSRVNLPSAEHATIMSDDDRRAKPFYYDRNRDLDPQLVWRGKDRENDVALEVMAPPIYVQERIRPKAIIDDLRRHSDANPTDDGSEDSQAQMFADFNGLPSAEARTEFYQHEANWSNRMILGDSLQVMSSLAEREGLKGQVQCIYLDPPYGIGFSSNFQWATDSRVVRDRATDITREPEQIRAFRDTWRDGVNSYLSYLRDRLVVARDLLTDSGSIFVQMGDENVHRIRALMDEVFGDANFVSQITFTKTSRLGTKLLAGRCDYIVWYAKDKVNCKYRPLHLDKPIGKDTGYRLVEESSGVRRPMNRMEQRDPSLLPKDSIPFVGGGLHSTGYTPSCYYDFEFEGRTINRIKYSWKTHEVGMSRLIRADRIWGTARTPHYVQKHTDYPVKQMDHLWPDLGGATDIRYVVETNVKAIQRCVLMTTDPGDLVLDPTCGSGTTAYVAEQWGRRWITIDTSRVALALARGRLMGARYPYYLLADSEDGAAKFSAIGTQVPPPYRHIASKAMSDRASSTSACPISLWQPSRTTPRSMSSGLSIRNSWSRSGSCSTKSAARRSRSGRCRGSRVTAGRMRRVRFMASGGIFGLPGSAI